MARYATSRPSSAPFAHPMAVATEPRDCACAGVCLARAQPRTIWLCRPPRMHRRPHPPLSHSSDAPPCTGHWAPWPCTSQGGVGGVSKVASKMGRNLVRHRASTCQSGQIATTLRASGMTRSTHVYAMSHFMGTTARLSVVLVPIAAAGADVPWANASAHLVGALPLAAQGLTVARTPSARPTAGPTVFATKASACARRVGKGRSVGSPSAQVIARGTGYVLSQQAVLRSANATMASHSPTAHSRPCMPRCPLAPTLALATVSASEEGASAVRTSRVPIAARQNARRAPQGRAAR
mmetsp:Transcript_120343/g.256898  ORF Transcript_120343/g.256898 Transcript_120343/m.256898 type:complete len:295 (+) Transcript_120343:1866-2750(+)